MVFEDFSALLPEEKLAELRWVTESLYSQLVGTLRWKHCQRWDGPRVWLYRLDYFILEIYRNSLDRQTSRETYYIFLIWVVFQWNMHFCGVSVIWFGAGVTLGKGWRLLFLVQKLVTTVSHFHCFMGCQIGIFNLLWGGLWVVSLPARVTTVKSEYLFSVWQTHRLTDRHIDRTLGLLGSIK